MVYSRKAGRVRTSSVGDGQGKKIRLENRFRLSSKGPWNSFSMLCDLGQTGWASVLLTLTCSPTFFPRLSAWNKKCVWRSGQSCTQQMLMQHIPLFPGLPAQIKGCGLYPVMESLQASQGEKPPLWSEQLSSFRGSDVPRRLGERQDCMGAVSRVNYFQ